MNIDQNELNEIFSYLIGMYIKAAREMVGHNMSIREVIKEGQQQVCDTNYIDNRLNVEIKDKKIFRIIGIG